MARFLPFILIPILILGGLGYWRYLATKQSLVTPQENQSEVPVEVPKTLPGASIEERVKSLEETVAKLAPQVNVKPAGSQAPSSSLDSRLTSLESTMQELTVRVSTLEKVAPAVTSGKTTIYIPLGAGGSWSNTEWNTLAEYEISLNPDNYPGYTGMNLEVNYRMVDPTGTGTIRLYNKTDSSITSSELSTTSTSYAVYSTSSFKLPSGTKTYRLQIKSPQGKDLLIQFARIKVSF